MHKYTDLPYFFGMKLSVSGSLVNHETWGKQTCKSNIYIVGQKKFNNH